MASANYDTILSNFDGKLTLMQWLKKVESAIADLLEDYEDKVSIADVPHKQATLALIRDVLTNLNGKNLSAYTRYDTEISGYEAVVILKNGANVDEDSARAYMRGMCGSDYLPLYDFDAPANTFFIDSEMQVWKPQYVANDYGLALFKVATLPSMQDVDGLRDDLDETQEFTNSLNQRVTALEEAPAGGTSLYLHQMTCQSPSFAMELITASSDQIQTGLQLSNNAYPKFVGVRRFTINGVGVAFVNWQLNPITNGSVLQGLAAGASALTTAEVSAASLITDNVTAL